jgi:hypothetical protein
VRYRAEELDYRALATIASRGNLRTLARGLVPRRGTVHAVFARNDPLPILSSVAALRSALVGKA